MRKLLTVLVVLFAICAAANAQDVIVKKDFTTIQAKILEIGEDVIKYKKWDKQDGPTYTISVANISAINYKDGTQDKFDTAPAQPSAAQQPASTLPTYTEEQLAEAKRKNKEAIDEFNNFKIQQIGKHAKPKEDAYSYCYSFGVTEESVLINEDISLTFKPGHKQFIGWSKKKGMEFYSGIDFRMYGYQGFNVIITNNTDKTIYIDKGQSFLSSGQTSKPYYKPSSTSTIKGSSSGASVNLGSIAGAIGIGGALGTLAGGVNVGGGSNSATQTTTYEQRVLTIPPKSSAILPEQIISSLCSYLWREPDEAALEGKGLSSPCIRPYLPCEFKINQEVQFKDSPCTFRLFFTYAFKEDCQETKSVQSSFYLNKVTGLDGKPGGFSYSRERFEGNAEINTKSCIIIMAANPKVKKDDANLKRIYGVQ